MPFEKILPGGSRTSKKYSTQLQRLSSKTERLSHNVNKRLAETPLLSAAQRFISHLLSACRGIRQKREHLTWKPI
ncbi:hypothetical protein GDO81_024780 [Engystomops pustulosus]|uniref:Uncharacterized protein n=1 Tax=Engystomops pustulosus TaxID=76066 RepID=A0AAV6ZRH7_ENGPU|nr:hypothetical protein GDO81_024780 [Engystomops pustulosus]